MIWIIAEALLALALLVGVVIWVALPAQKKRRGASGTAPKKPPVEEREREAVLEKRKKP